MKYKIIAHRGINHKTYGENTYLSLKKALYQSNIEGIEFDIRLTKDNKIVICHDSNITRVSNGNVIIEHKTLKELKQYNFGKKIYQTIPTLDKILDINSNKLFLIEIKTNHNEKIFANILYKYLINYKDKNIYIMSFNKKVLNYLKKIDNTLNIGIIYLFKRNIKLKYNFYCINHNFITKKLKDKILNKHKQLFLWTINSNNDIKNLKNKLTNLNNIYLIMDINSQFYTF